MMLQLSDLRAARRIIAHRNTDGLCPDAVAAVLLLRDALGSVPVTWVNYTDVARREIRPEPGLLFIDMTPHVDRYKDGTITASSMYYLRALADAGTIVLDHHRGTADVVVAFGDRGVFADEVRDRGVSGAMLAFREVWSPTYHAARIRDDDKHDRALHLADLAGIRDTWLHGDPRWREACAQAAALAWWPWADLDAARLAAHLDAMIALGPTLVLRNENRARQCLASAWRGTLAGQRVIIFEGSSHDASNVADIMDGNLVVAFHYEIDEEQAPVMRASIRSRGSINCDALAKLHGGGGHRGAAGFTHRIDGPGSGPYASLQGMIAHDLLTLAGSTAAPR